MQKLGTHGSGGQMVSFGIPDDNWIMPHTSLATMATIIEEGNLRVDCLMARGS